MNILQTLGPDGLVNLASAMALCAWTITHLNRITVDSPSLTLMAHLGLFCASSGVILAYVQQMVPAGRHVPWLSVDNFETLMHVAFVLLLVADRRSRKRTTWVRDETVHLHFN